MRLQQLLDHHGVGSNPFAQEDAQSDSVFKSHCIRSTYHPSWDKIFGDPADPSTSIVFGEKGAGKTAIGMQIVQHLAQYNQDHADRQDFVILYNDLNPCIGQFLSRRRQRVDKALGDWSLWDHIDAILALGVTQLVDRLLGVKQPQHPAAVETSGVDPRGLEPAQARDILLLAACYDQSTAENRELRWQRLARKLRFSTWRSYWDLALGIGITVALIALLVWQNQWSSLLLPTLGMLPPWPWAVIAGAWAPRLWRLAKSQWQAWRIARKTRVLQRDVGSLRRLLMRMPTAKLAGQPLPGMSRGDDRYEFLSKFQQAIRPLGFTGIVVLLDRLDEPHAINGSAPLMRAILWPMLDNKFLKQPGIGLKLLLPAELVVYIDREDRHFYERARLDKQNMIRSLRWTGQSLYDVADARVKACATAGSTPTLGSLFEEAVDSRRLQSAFESLRVPRHLFKFLDRVLTAHCVAHTDDKPSWKINSGTFESTLAVYQRELDASDRGVGAV